MSVKRIRYTLKPGLTEKQINKFYKAYKAYKKRLAAGVDPFKPVPAGKDAAREQKFVNHLE